MKSSNQPSENLGRSATSCGCAHREELIARNTNHGHTPRGGRTSTYARWTSIINRCYNPNSQDFKNYGGRGIKMCDRWRNSFEAFLEDMGEPPPGMSIDRIDNSGEITNPEIVAGCNSELEQVQSTNVSIPHAERI